MLGNGLYLTLLLGCMLASYHRSFKEGIAPLPREKSTELVFDLLPTSIIFKAGHRIRVIITCADKNNYLTLELSPKPVATSFVTPTLPHTSLYPLFQHP